MKVALASRYRNLMLVLFPATFGLGTALLWLRSLTWPLSIDEAGIMLRHRRRVEWDSIRKIGLSRSYLDGRVSQVRIHHAGGVCKIPVHALEDGQQVARTILAMFERAKRSRALQNPVKTELSLGRDNVGDPLMKSETRQSASLGDFTLTDAELWAHEMTKLRESLASRSEKIQVTVQPARSGYERLH